MTTINPSRKVIGLTATTTPVDRKEPISATMEDVSARLMQLLPRSLELNEVLQIFADEVSLLVDFQALSFTREDGVTGFATAPQARNRANYKLEIAGRYLGDIMFSRSRKFENGELVRIESALSCLVYPLRNALMYGEAIASARIDPLTQLGNRAALNEAMSTEMTLSDRYTQEFSLLMIDIDHFKQVNDQHGHLVGDEVLGAVAQTVQALLRRSDTAFRFGGEEFVVLLRNTDVNGASYIAERLRRAIECAPVRGTEGMIEVTISTGIAKYEHGLSYTALLERADKALYQAKENGRNRVCIAA